MKYLVGTQELCLTLKTDKTSIIKWYVDAAFAVHSDFKLPTGKKLTTGRGSIISMSQKQKLYTKISTEVELVGADDESSLISWTKLFLEAQGYKAKQNILYQDNIITILLQENVKNSLSKRTRHLNFKTFFPCGSGRNPQSQFEPYFYS